MTQYVNVHEGVAGTDDVRARAKLRQLSPEAVDTAIASELEKLRARADASDPAVEEVTPQLVEATDRQLREERRLDTLKRLKSPVLVQLGDLTGSIKFKHDPQVRETSWGSGSGAPETRSPEQ